MASKFNSVLHIGMPKCMSTSLQAWLREAKDTFFIGIGPSKFVDPDVLHVFQRQIVATPSHFYDKAGVARVFDRCVSQAMDKGSKLVALSDETIPYPLGYGRMDTSYTERLSRLRDVLPGNTTVLMIVRRPEDYLMSTYKYRTVMNGMSFSFEEYVKRLLLLGDTYFLATLKFFDYAQEAKRIFGDVRVIAMEQIQDEPDVLVDFLNGLGAGGADKIPRQNVGMANDKLENFRNLYASFGDTLADDDFNVMSPAERNLCVESGGYFGSVLGQVLAKEHTLAGLRNIADKLPAIKSKTTFELSDETRARLKDYIAQSNAGLRRHHDLDTDLYSYDEI